MLKTSTTGQIEQPFTDVQQEVITQVIGKLLSRLSNFYPLMFKCVISDYVIKLKVNFEPIFGKKSQL